jgi:dUTP pyrophosphatase
MIIKFKKLHPSVVLPVKQTEGSSGFDLQCFYDEGDGLLCIEPRKHLLVKTGLAVEIPAGYELQIRARSGLALKHGVTILNGIGTIDSDYRGEIGVILYNTGDQPFYLRSGDRIAQLVPCQLPTVTIKAVKELKDTERGDGGFGSTGN